jgi:hypothetical protein
MEFLETKDAVVQIERAYLLPEKMKVMTKQTL